MPTVVNGIGTWYYGKRRIHARKGVCEACGNLTNLESYDTTLFVVVFFVPVIPLGQKRILEKCAVCGRHRVLPLKKWEEAKVNQGAVVLDQLQREPDNREYLAQAIAFAHVYQDEPLLREVVEPLARDHTDDAEIQLQLAEAYAYFARWPEAEQAYRAALAVRDDDLIRERLAWALLKQDRPDEARPYLQHVLDKRLPEAAGSLFFLVQGYQAAGRHDEALALMDERDAAFPELVNVKEYQEQRRTSARLKGTGKKVAAAFLKEDGKTGYRSGNWTAALPRWIAVLILLGLVGAYLGSALWIGQARKVFLVNGTGRAYAVSIGGREHQLPPGKATPVRLAEGDVEVAFPNAKPSLEPVRCRIESTFWTRPFANRTFVINPDRAAIVLEQETFYAKANPPAGNPPQVHFGQVAYAFSGLDYEFENFPATITVSGNAAVRKTRVTLAPPLAPEARLQLVLERLDPREQIDFCKRVVLLDPGNELYLGWLVTRLPAAEALDFLKLGLDDRPLLVDWHRAYQSLSERARPEADLRPQYEKLVAETQRHPDAVYLLGRIEPDRDKAKQLFRQAAAGEPPSGHAMNALAYNAMSHGQFAEAVAWYEKALPLLPEQTMLRRSYHDALLAKGDYDRLLEQVEQRAPLTGSKFLALMEVMQVHAVRGDKAKARETLAQAVQAAPPDQRGFVQPALEGLLCCWEGDAEGFVQKSAKGGGSFELSVLRGDLPKAAGFVRPEQHDAHARYALLYLAAVRRGDKELAATYRKDLVAKLAEGTREERLLGDVLAGRKTLAQHPPERMVLDPRDKRVFLAVLAQEHPDRAKELVELAKRLDFYRDAISLCLRKVLDGKKL